MHPGGIAVIDGTKYLDIICHKIYDLSPAGQSRLSKHAEGGKHKGKPEKCDNFLKGRSNKKKTSNNDSVTVKKTCDHQTLEQYFAGSDATKAEIVWTLNSVMSGFSFRSSDSLGKIFSIMFPYSSTASAFSLGRTKAQYVVKHGLAPYFKQLIFSDIKKSEILVVSCDGKLSQATQISERVMFVRY